MFEEFAEFSQVRRRDVGANPLGIGQVYVGVATGGASASRAAVGHEPKADLLPVIVIGLEMRDLDPGPGFPAGIGVMENLRDGFETAVVGTSEHADRRARGLTLAWFLLATWLTASAVGPSAAAVVARGVAAIVASLG